MACTVQTWCSRINCFHKSEYLTEITIYTIHTVECRMWLDSEEPQMNSLWTPCGKGSLALSLYPCVLYTLCLQTPVSPLCESSQSSPQILMRRYLTQLLALSRYKISKSAFFIPKDSILSELTSKHCFFL